MCRRWLLAVLLLLSVLAPSQMYAQIYKWVDEDGQVHYGSRPVASAQAEDVTAKVKSTGNFVELETTATSYGNTITMLSTTWCSVCKRAKTWLNAKGIAYTELDVEKDEEGKQRYRELNGRGVPIILVGKQRMNGFSEARMEEMLKTAGLL